MGWAALSAAANRVAYDRLGSVPVAAGAITGRGFWQQGGELLLNGEAIMVDFLLAIEVATFGGLGWSDPVTVDGKAFKVLHQPIRIGDGTWANVPLLEVTAQALNLTTLDGRPIVTLDGRNLTTLATA